MSRPLANDSSRAGTVGMRKLPVSSRSTMEAQKASGASVWASMLRTSHSYIPIVFAKAASADSVCGRGALAGRVAAGATTFAAASAGEARLCRRAGFVLRLGGASSACSAGGLVGDGRNTAAARLWRRTALRDGDGEAAEAARGEEGGVDGGGGSDGGDGGDGGASPALRRRLASDCPCGWRIGLPRRAVGWEARREDGMVLAGGVRRRRGTTTEHVTEARTWWPASRHTLALGPLPGCGDRPHNESTCVWRYTAARHSIALLYCTNAGQIDQSANHSS